MSRFLFSIRKSFLWLVQEDRSRKFWALFFAAILYTIVSFELRSSREIPGVTVPVQTSPGLVLMEESPQKVTLKVSGIFSSMDILSPQSIKVKPVVIQPDLYTDGIPYSAVLAHSQFKLPFGYVVSSVEPNVLKINVDREITKELPVTPLLEKNSLTAGYNAVGKAIPVAVHVTGPSSMLKDLKELRTDSIPLARITQDFDINAKISVPHPAIQTSPESVMVQVHMIREVETKRYSGLPLHVLKDGQNAKSQVENLDRLSIQVVVSANKKILASLGPEKIKAYIDVSSLKESGIHELPVDCWITENNVEIKSVSPKTIKVKFVK